MPWHNHPVERRRPNTRAARLGLRALVNPDLNLRPGRMAIGPHFFHATVSTRSAARTGRARIQCRACGT
jgi:hypothetical protein